jgi:hypothetical protein
MKRLRELEEENARLKPIAAGLPLDKATLLDNVKEKDKACRQAQSGGPISRRLEGVRGQTMRRSSL